MFYSFIPPPPTVIHIIVLISLLHMLEQLIIIIPSSHTLRYISGTHLPTVAQAPSSSVFKNSMFEVHVLHNPVRSKDELYNAKEVSHAQLNGIPGLMFRSGRTMHSYQWSPIAPASPIVTRTRTKTKS